MIFILLIATNFAAKIKVGYFAEGDRSILKKFYSLKANRSECRRICDVIGQNCPWMDGFCYISLKSGENNTVVGNIQSCNLLCKRTANCKIWNFTKRSIHRRSGECELFQNFTSIKECQSKFCSTGIINNSLKFKKSYRKPARISKAKVSKCRKFDRIVSCKSLLRSF